MGNQSSSLLYQPSLRIFDQSSLGAGFDPLQSFAIDDTLCSSVGSGESPATIRTWVHHNTVVLGIHDSRLPYLKEGVRFLTENGHRVIVRNSGGLAVVLDQNILNISLVLSEKENKIDINAGYEAMVILVKQLLTAYQVNIEAKEIVGSYCPGSYDLSINNRKFAGISQRRLRGGIAVQVYLCVGDSGSERAALLQEFYERSLNGEQTKFSFPKIRPETMASLSELTGKQLDVPTVMVQVYEFLKRNSQHLIQSQLSLSEINLFDFNYKRVVERNEKALRW
jgi:octanoyl-[GcvH]:protein N-octanoyltransferase